jgi:hypothetical protein
MNKDADQMNHEMAKGHVVTTKNSNIILRARRMTKLVKKDDKIIP